MKLLQDFNSEINDIKFIVFPMGQLNKFHIPLEIFDQMLYMKKQVRFQLVLGSLLYIFMNSRSDLKNPFRDLSKRMDRDDQNVCHQILQLLNFIKYISKLGIVFNVSETLISDMKFYSDSYFSGEPSNKNSISGYLIYIN